MSAPLAGPESTLTDDQVAVIALEARNHQLEVELHAEKLTSERLRTQRDNARHAGGLLIAKRDELARELRESQELVKAQALSLEEMVNRVRKADLALGKLTGGMTRA